MAISVSATPGLDPNKIRTKRVSTTVAGSGNSTITITWSTPFPSAAYTVALNVVNDIGGAGMEIERQRTQTASAITVLVVNGNIGAQTGVVHAVAIAD